MAGGFSIVMVGAAVYPLPAAVAVMETTAPLETKAVATAPDPPPPGDRHHRIGRVSLPAIGDGIAGHKGPGKNRGGGGPPRGGVHHGSVIDDRELELPRSCEIRVVDGDSSRVRNRHTI